MVVKRGCDMPSGLVRPSPDIGLLYRPGVWAEATEHVH